MPRSTSTQFITTRRLYIYLSFHARSRAARAQSCNVILATARRSGKVWDGWIRPGIPCTCRVLRGVTCIKGGTALPSLRTRRKGTTDRDSELADNFNVKVTRLMSFYYLVAPFSLIFFSVFSSERWCECVYECRSVVCVSSVYYALLLSIPRTHAITNLFIANFA